MSLLSLPKRMGQVFKDLITTKDGETYAPSRVYWLLTAIQFLALSQWAIIALKQPWDPTSYGTGAGIILTAGGLGVWITRKSEPNEH